MAYHGLSVEERVIIQLGRAQGFRLRKIAHLINRSPSTISRETGCKQPPGTERFEWVPHRLRERLSPEQIAGKLRGMNTPNLRDAYVCRETIHTAMYALSVEEPIICLRQGKSTRRPCAGGVERRCQIPDMLSIPVRPPEIEDRLMPGYREGDLSKANASAVGALVERTSGYPMRVKICDATVTSVMEVAVPRSIAGLIQRMGEVMQHARAMPHDAPASIQ